MWIMCNNAFLSIVDKSKVAHCLLVRARRAGEIEAVFPAAKVRKGEGTDYLFRADILRADVATAIAREVMNITYGNFKGSVLDDARHDAYMGVWNVMMDYQRGRYDRKPAPRRGNFLRRSVSRSAGFDIANMPPIATDVDDLFDRSEHPPAKRATEQTKRKTR